MAEVSVWESELEAGTLPSVCVKSGLTAFAQLTFRFITRNRAAQWVEELSGGWVPVGDWGARRVDATLPLTKRWRTTFIAFRIVAILAAAAAAVLLVSTDAAPEAMRMSVLGFAAGAFTVYAVTQRLTATFNGPRPV